MYKRQVLTQRAGEEDFETCIYYTGGALKEYLTEAEAPFYPEKGETVTALTAFSFAEEDGLLIVTSAGRDGQSHTMHIALVRE